MGTALQAKYLGECKASGECVVIFPCQQQLCKSPEKHSSLLGKLFSAGRDKRID